MIDRPRICLVSSVGACGIAEHSAMLAEAVAPRYHCYTDPDMLDPAILLARWGGGWPIIHLNYHRALHSRWTPEIVRKVRQQTGARIVITFHDTYAESDLLLEELLIVADAIIVHEPVTLATKWTEHAARLHYWRQGVPAWEFPMQYGWDSGYTSLYAGIPREVGSFKAWANQPIVGTVGFPFPWKNYDLLAEASAAAGWALVLIAPTATDAQVARWRELNPASLILTDFVGRRDVVSYLSGCDATAFLYTCANTGTSGAIRQGIAARKPVIATHPAACRQFTDLYWDTLASQAIRWISPDTPLTVENVAYMLSTTGLTRADPVVIRLAHTDSWQQLGKRYIALYDRLLEHPA